MSTLSAEQLAEVQTLIDTAVATSQADTDAFFLIFSAALVFMSRQASRCCARAPCA
jgi:hypothetical protein